MTVPFCQNAPDIENRADGLGAGDASPAIRIGRKHTNINPINYCRTKATGLDLGSVVGMATASKSRVPVPCHWKLRQPSVAFGRSRASRVVMEDHCRPSSFFHLAVTTSGDSWAGWAVG